MMIERIGKTTGRWQRYNLVVDGVDVGQVRRTVTVGRDGLAGRQQPRYDSWKIHGTACDSQEGAERTLIERARRFGHLPPVQD
jgi:hypothetical protein